MSKEPALIGEALEEVLSGLRGRLRDAGIPMRSREERLEALMDMVHQDFPEARLQDLRGDPMDFYKAARSEEECAYYRENRRCPQHCGNNGRIWFVNKVDTLDGPEYRVDWHMCGLYHEWAEAAKADQDRIAKRNTAMPEQFKVRRKGNAK